MGYVCKWFMGWGLCGEKFPTRRGLKKHITRHITMEQTMFIRTANHHISAKFLNQRIV